MSDLDTLQQTLQRAMGGASAVAAETSSLAARVSAGIYVAIVNHATALTEADLTRLVSALRIQVTRDFLPAWGIQAHLVVREPRIGEWALGFFDDADQANALGYHDLTAEGLPLGKVFVKTTLAAGGLVSVTASHELLEMLADPWINVLIADATDPSKAWIREVGDPVEADIDGYLIDGVQVSDFVTPAYFEPDLKLAGPFDFARRLSAPLPALRPGGYLSYVQRGQWHQVFGNRLRLASAVILGKPGGSGRFRRAQTKHQWRRST